MNARGAGAEHHADPPGAVTGNGGANLRLDLHRGGQQQLVITALRRLQTSRHRRQLAGYRADRQVAATDPTALRLHATGIAGQQRRRDGLLAAAEGANQAQVRQISRHQASPAGSART